LRVGYWGWILLDRDDESPYWEMVDAAERSERERREVAYHRRQAEKRELDAHIAKITQLTPRRLALMSFWEETKRRDELNRQAWLEGRPERLPPPPLPPLDPNDKLL
jgi:hypothetical protein